MTTRKRNDSVKDGVGIDGAEGQRYSREHAVNPWDSNPKGSDVDERGANVYQNKNADFLRNKLPYEATEESRDIWNDVEGQSGPNDRKIRSRGQP
jgi:hypothetical protein